MRFGRKKGGATPAPHWGADAERLAQIADVRRLGLRLRTVAYDLASQQKDVEACASRILEEAHIADMLADRLAGLGSDPA